MFTFALITGVKNGWLDARHLRPRRAQSVDRGHRLHRSEQRRDQHLRRHQQVQQSRLLPDAQAQNRRLPRPGTSALGCVRAAEVASQRADKLARHPVLKCENRVPVGRFFQLNLARKHETMASVRLGTCRHRGRVRVATFACRRVSGGKVCPHLEHPHLATVRRNRVELAGSFHGRTCNWLLDLSNRGHLDFCDPEALRERTRCR